MTSIYRRLPKVNSLVGSARPSKPSRPFGAGILPAYEDDRCHYGSLGLPTPLPVDPPVIEPSTRERDYEAACVAVAGRRAEWLTARPAGPFEGPEYEAWLAAIDRGHYPDEAPAGDFWSDELGHLASLLGDATPARRAEIERRIDGIMGMLAPRLEIERLQAESVERQMAESWAMDQIEAGAERFDGRYTDEDAFNMGACG